MARLVQYLARKWRRLVLRTAPPESVSPFIRLSQGRGFNMRYLVFWESLPEAILVHFEEGSYFLVEGEEGGNLLRMLNTIAADPMIWARGHPAAPEGTN